MLLPLISLFSSSIAQLRNYFFDYNIIKSYRSKLPTISIGNISFGGTGKTPFVIYLANLIISKGYRPIILSRGYKGKHKSITQIRDENQIRCAVEQSGDELYLVANRVQSPIIASKVKFKAIPFIDKNLTGSVLIIDDGFQHRKIKRDLDIVLIDSKTIEKPFVYPKGYLREPYKNLKRANVIALSEDIPPNIIENVLPSNKIVIKYRKKLTHLIDMLSKPIEFSELIYKDIVLVSGLANNAQFYNSIEMLGFNIRKHFEFKDHYRYKESDIVSILQFVDAKNIDTILTTEKDFYKLLKFSEVFRNSGVSLFSTILDLEVVESEDKFIAFVEQIL